MVAALIISGVVAATGGPANTPPTPAAVPPPTSITIGDPRTADPCSLIDVPALSRYGTAQLRSGGNFSGCSATIGARIQVFIDLLSPEEAQRFDTVGLVPMTGGVVETRGPLTIVRHEAMNNGCSRSVRLPDDHVVVVYVRSTDDGDPCDVAESSTLAAVDIMHGTGIEVRAPLDDKIALARIDACSLLHPADLQAVLGLADVVSRPGFGNWRCTWDDNVGRRTAVRVVFSQSHPVLESSSTPATFNGLRGYLTSGPGGYCIAHITHSTQDASQYFAYAYVQTFGSPPAGDPCEVTRALANVVAARLPPPN